MPFKKALDRIVDTAGGGVGATIVDDEGEFVDLANRGDSFEVRLAGAHHGIILSLLNDIQERIGSGDVIRELYIRSDRFTYSVAPVKEGLFVVLIQDRTGIPALGMKALRDGIPEINELI
ncbi:MAG: roadblock/LC7 domain-containing protein [bacterium]|nr:roadblock/LC7 domain-containing protein [bacterium]MDT8396645.1 roadblock/LC7 domain-containing protein [bacterium]